MLLRGTEQKTVDMQQTKREKPTKNMESVQQKRIK